MTTSAPSFTEDRLTVKIRKDRGKIEVGLGAHTEVAAGMGIHRNDRLYRDLKKAVHRDDARIDAVVVLPACTLKM